MSFSSVVGTMPIRDRQRSLVFYCDDLGLDAVGEPVDDGVRWTDRRALHVRGDGLDDDLAALIVGTYVDERTAQPASTRSGVHR